jgi:hypothetical protein
VPKRRTLEQAIVSRLGSVVFLEVTELQLAIDGTYSAKQAAIRRLLSSRIIEYHPRWPGCVRLIRL